nr:hypothetical protein [Caulobacter henricii]
MRGYGVRRSAGTSFGGVTPHPPTASRRAPPSPSGRGLSLRQGRGVGHHGRRRSAGLT